jgi:hypothetical protein
LVVSAVRVDVLVFEHMSVSAAVAVPVRASAIWVRVLLEVLAHFDFAKPFNYTAVPAAAAVTAAANSICSTATTPCATSVACAVAAAAHCVACCTQL